MDHGNKYSKIKILTTMAMAMLRCCDRTEVSWHACSMEKRPRCGQQCVQHKCVLFFFKFHRPQVDRVSPLELELASAMRAQALRARQRAKTATRQRQNSDSRANYPALPAREPAPTGVTRWPAGCPHDSLRCT